MKIVFFGTPEYVLPVLRKFQRKFTAGADISPIVAVVTQPPKETGRKKVLTYSAVDKWAHNHKIPIYYEPSDLRRDKIKADVAVVAAYGKILKREDINYFPHGILNIHPSLLPAWRGASPITATLIAGESTTGGTIIKLDQEMDHGPILTACKEEVLGDDTTELLRKRLFEKSAGVMVELLPAYLAGRVKLKPQNHSQATFTRRITKENGFLETKQLTAALRGEKLKDKIKVTFMDNYLLPVSPESIDRFIRAMHPWPGTYTVIEKKRLKILEAHLEKDRLVLDKVQLEGKKPVSFEEFKRGYPEIELGVS